MAGRAWAEPFVRAARSISLLPSPDGGSSPRMRRTAEQGRLGRRVTSLEGVHQRHAVAVGIEVVVAVAAGSVQHLRVAEVQGGIGDVIGDIQPARVAHGRIRPSRSIRTLKPSDTSEASSTSGRRPRRSQRASATSRAMRCRSNGP